MGISMRVLDGEQPGGVAVEWCSGGRCIRREITGPWPEGFQAVQAAVLAELAGSVDVANQEPTPRVEAQAPAGEVQTCKVCLRRHRGKDYMYCSDRCRERAGVAVGDHRGGRWARK